MEIYRDTSAEIDLSALQANLAYVHHICQKPIMAVVKANAYGHGAIEIAKSCLASGLVKMFAVACIQEALELRQAGIQQDILVLGATRIEDVTMACLNDITINVFDEAYAKKLCVLNLPKPLKVHIKLDTGMNRIGLKDKATFESVLAILKQQKQIVIEGVFTHYGAADEKNDSYQRQFDKFKAIIGDHQFKYCHAANTAGALYHHEDFTNMVRIGIALYGIEPDGRLESALKPVMRLKTKVVMVKEIAAGESVGYGFTYTASQKQRIATLPIGYGDGLIRQNQGRHVYIRNHYYPIVGRVCMDQMMVSVDETVQVGDEVEIFGEHISLTQMASELNTIPYEIVCLISSRVPRIYCHAF